MDIGENLQYSTTVFLNDQLPDLQFFPESGQLVHGLSSRVAVKAIGPDGKGIKVEGVVVDRQGKKITNFKSNALGMGVFFFKRIVSACTKLRCFYLMLKNHLRYILYQG